MTPSPIRKNMHSQLKSKKNKHTLDLAERAGDLREALGGILAEGGRYTLLGSYPQLPNSFTGNDVDVLVSDIIDAKIAFRRMGFVFRQQQKSELRAFLYIKSTNNWISVDIETINAYPDSSKKILEYILSNPIVDSKSGLQHPPQAGILAYKTMKYILNGYVHSWYQLQDLHENWRISMVSDCKVALKLLQNHHINKESMNFVNFIAGIDKKDFFYDPSFNEYLDSKRKVRHARRLVYQGRINTKILVKKPLLLFSLFYARFFGSERALPAIALVGNDGSGKTAQCQRLKDELYKMDPLHIVMRGNEAWLPGWGRLRKKILIYIKNNKREKRKSSSLILWLIGWIGEVGDYIDKWYRYQIGISWANAGFGFVLFERYPTDRLRGEYPGPKWSLFPLEQFFPMPEMVVLLDVKEEDSLKRKAHDSHTYNEMYEKRENYLQLINEIQPSVVISPDLTLDEIQKQVSKLIWDNSFSKQQGTGRSSCHPAKWRPERRKVYSSSDRRKQKDGFL